MDADAVTQAGGEHAGSTATSAQTALSPDTDCRLPASQNSCCHSPGKANQAACYPSWVHLNMTQEHSIKMLASM